MQTIEELERRRDEIREQIVCLTREDADLVGSGQDEKNYESVSRLYHSMNVIETLANRIRRQAAAERVKRKTK